MQELFENSLIALGMIALIAIVLISFICLCLLVKVARNHYLNAKCDIECWIEFLQWKSSKHYEAAKRQEGED